MVEKEKWVALEVCLHCTKGGTAFVILTHLGHGFRRCTRDAREGHETCTRGAREGHERCARSARQG